MHNHEWTFQKDTLSRAPLYYRETIVFFSPSFEWRSPRTKLTDGFPECPPELLVIPLPECLAKFLKEDGSSSKDSRIPAQHLFSPLFLGGPPGQLTGTAWTATARRTTTAWRRRRREYKKCQAVSVLTEWFCRKTTQSFPKKGRCRSLAGVNFLKNVLGDFFVEFLFFLCVPQKLRLLSRSLICGAKKSHWVGWSFVGKDGK